MFNFLKKNEKTAEKVKLKIKGMHCTSCSMSVDDSLEELDGVYSSVTKYANGVATISYDPDKTSPETFKKVIKELGYSAEVFGEK